MNRTAPIDHPVNDLIASRWSPVGWADRSVAPDDLASLFEAARWAPSAFNEQPWSFLVARREQADLFARVLGCLVEANQAWARQAPVLVLSVASERFGRNNKPNGTALYDLGQAVAGLTVEATARGLSVHQMSGILPDQARAEFGVPDGHRVVTALAIGHAAPDVAALPEDLQARDTAPRTRKPSEAFVFGERWGEPINR